MKVFDGNKYLEEQECEFKLSNGKSYTVKEIRPEQLDAVMNMPDEPDAKAITASVASMLDIEPKELEGIGIIELKGVMDFLSENLLSSK